MPARAPAVSVPTPQRMSATIWLLLIALSMLWGGSFLFAKVAVRELGPVTLVFWRVLIAASILWLVHLLRGGAVPREARVWRDFAIMGLLNNIVPFTLIFWAQKELPAGLAAVLNGSMPLWTVLIAHVATDDEKAGPLKLAGVAVGLCGVAVIVGPAAFSGLDKAAALAPFAVVLATISYGITNVFGRRFKGREPMQTAAGQLTCSTIMALPLALATEGVPQISGLSSETVASVLALAVLSTALAYVLFFRILSAAGATNLALVTFLIPISAIILGVAFLGESVTLRQLAGMALVGFGLSLIDGRLWSRRSA